MKKPSRASPTAKLEGLREAAAGCRDVGSSWTTCGWPGVTCRTSPIS